MKEKMQNFFKGKANKAIAIMLSLAMVFAMVPNFSLTAKAAESGTGIVPRTTALDLTTTGTYNNGVSIVTFNPANDITDSAEGWEWHTNGVTVDGTAYTGTVLVLKGANIHSENSSDSTTYGINLPNNTTIVLASGTTNIVAAGNATHESYGINDDGTLTIDGTGTLSATGGAADANSFGIDAFTDITISGGTVTATGGTASQWSYGIYTVGSINLSGGLVIARSGAAPLSNSMSNANSGSLALLTGSNTANFAVWGESGKYSVIDKKSTGSLALFYGVIGIELQTWKNSTNNWGANSGYKAEIIDGVNTLTIKNLIINVDTTITANNESFGIRLKGNVTINLEGTNIIHSGDTANVITCGIHNMDNSSNTTIQGKGTLVSIGGSSSNSSFGISSYGNISISQGNVTAIGGTSQSKSYGINSEYGAAAISDGNVTAIGGPATNVSRGICVCNSLDISGSIITVGTEAGTLNYGLWAGNGKINISGGTGTATTSCAMNHAPAFSKGIGFLTGSNSTQSATWGVLPYTITVSPESLDFGSKASGYTAPNAQTVTVQNMSNQNVTLTQPTSTYYDIGTLSKTALAPNETATFTVQPKTGLTYGNRDEAITVSTDHGTSATVSAKFGVLDKTVPTATINVNGNTWNSFFNTATLGTFFKENKTVSVTASDTESGIKTIEYLLSNTKFDTQEAVTGTWKDITSAKQFSIAPNSKQYIYVRVTDNDGNISIINSDGVVLYTDSSATAADITFTKTGSTDKSTQVTLNGNTVKEIKNGSNVIAATNYTVGADGTITFKATYLNSLADGSYTLAVSYNPMGETYSEKTGNQAPGNTAINLTVQKADDEVKNISPIGKTYDGTAVSAPTYDKSGTGAATIEYKGKDADDSTYTTTAPKNAGNYTVRISVAADDNYKASSATADFSIAQKEVTITGATVAASKEYDGNTTAAVKDIGTLSANYDGDNLKIAAGTAAYNDNTAENGKTVTFTGFALTGSAKDNYKLTAQPANTTANITPKGLTVDVSVKDKQYNGKNDAEFSGTPALVGVVSGDKVNLTNGTPTFASTAIANGIAINFTAFTISGAEAVNYTLTQPTGITASIKNYTATKDIEYVVNSNGWLKTDFVVTAKTGFQLSTSNSAGGTWSDTLNASDETANGKLEFYVKNTTTGAISDKVTENYKIDKTAPAGTQITFTTNPAKNILHAITFGLFFNDTTDVTVSATDSLSGIQQYEYLLVSDDVDNVNGHWNTCDGSFSIDPQFKGAIIARAVDNAGNYSSVITSDKFVVDKQTPTAPNITATVSGKTYNSNWTSGNVELEAFGSSAPSGIDHYEYKIGDSGTWIAMPQQSGINDSTTGNAIGDMMTVSSNMNDAIHIRVVSNSGVAGNESIITVRKDAVVPSLHVAVSGITGQWTQDPVTFTLSNTANNVSPVTYWVKIGSDNWTQLSGNTCIVSGNVNTTYQFKAVSSSGLASSVSDIYTVKLASDALKEVIKNIDNLPDPNNAPGKQITDNEQLIKDTKILFDMLSKDEQSGVGQDRIDKLNKLIGRLNALLVIIPKDTGTGIAAGNIGTSVNLQELNDPGVGKVVVKLAVNPIVSTNTQSANIAIATQSLGQSGTNLVAAFDISLMKSVFDAAGNQTSTGKVSNSNIRGPITVQIPVPAGYQGRTNLQVVYIDNNGNVTPLTTTLVTIDGVQYLQFTTTHFSVYAVTAPEQKSPVHNPETGDGFSRFPIDAVSLLGLAVLSISIGNILSSKRKLGKRKES